MMGAGMKVIMYVTYLALCLVCAGGFPGGSDDKASACNAGDLGLILGLGRSPGEGKGFPLHGISKSQT